MCRTLRLPVIRLRPRTFLNECKMATSNEAIREIAKALRRYVDAANLEKIVNELLDIPGNRNFRDAIEALARDVMGR